MRKDRASIRGRGAADNPTNRFESLAGTNPRRYSIRVTRQYRVTFEWNGKDAENVRFEDYH